MVNCHVSAEGVFHSIKLKLDTVFCYPVKERAHSILSYGRLQPAVVLASKAFFRFIKLDLLKLDTVFVTLLRRELNVCELRQATANHCSSVKVFSAS